MCSTHRPVSTMSLFIFNLLHIFNIIQKFVIQKSSHDVPHLPHFLQFSVDATIPQPTWIMSVIHVQFVWRNLSSGNIVTDNRDEWNIPQVCSLWKIFHTFTALSSLKTHLKTIHTIRVNYSTSPSSQSCAATHLDFASTEVTPSQQKAYSGHNTPLWKRIRTKVQKNTVHKSVLGSQDHIGVPTEEYQKDVIWIIFNKGEQLLVKLSWVKFIASIELEASGQSDTFSLFQNIPHLVIAMDIELETIWQWLTFGFNTDLRDLVIVHFVSQNVVRKKQWNSSWKEEFNLNIWKKWRW